MNNELNLKYFNQNMTKIVLHSHLFPIDMSCYYDFYIIAIFFFLSSSSSSFYFLTLFFFVNGGSVAWYSKHQT